MGEKGKITNNQCSSWKFAALRATFVPPAACNCSPDLFLQLGQLQFHLAIGRRRLMLDR